MTPASSEEASKKKNLWRNMIPSISGRRTSIVAAGKSHVSETDNEKKEDRGKTREHVMGTHFGDELNNYKLKKIERPRSIRP